MRGEKMKLFASYDHRNDQGILVEKIRDCLAERGHELWVDTRELYPGVEWRRKIVDGISGSKVTLAFLSEYTREEQSACLDELAIAVCTVGMDILPIMLEIPGSFRIPPTVSQFQWLDLSDWNKYYEKSSVAFDSYVHEKTDCIVEAIEDEAHIRFLGEIERLNRALQPEVKKARYYSYLEKPMTGRTWLLEKLNGYAEHGTNRFMYITSGPGYGKSHFLAEMMHYNPYVVAGYFFDYAFAGPTTARKCLVSIAYQMATRLSDYRVALIEQLKNSQLFDLNEPAKNIKALDEMKPTEVFRLLFDKALFKTVDGNRENMLIVLDGIDEANYDGTNDVLELLRANRIANLPKWLKIVFTARPLSGIQVAVDSMEVEQIDLNCTESEKDIHLFFQECFKEELASGIITDNKLKALTRKCEKTFIYADAFMLTYKKDPSIIDNIENLPSGLNGIYDLFFQRIFNKNTKRGTDSTSFEIDAYPTFVRKALEIMVANTGALSKNIFKKVLSWPEERYSSFIRIMGSFVIVSGETGNESISFYHKALYEWIISSSRSDRWVVSVSSGRETILRYCEIILHRKRKPELFYQKLPFEDMDFCYTSICSFYNIDPIRYGDEYDNLMTQLRFLFFYQRELYKQSKHLDSKRVFEEICNSVNDMSEDVLNTYKRFIPWAYDIRAEVEMAEKNWYSATTWLLDAKKNYKALLEKEIDIYALLERNIAFCYKNTDPERGEKILQQLLKDLKDKQYPQKNYDLAHTYYHLCVLYYNQSDFERAIENGENALKLIPLCHDDPREISVIVDNELGWSYCRNQQYVLAETHFRKSLTNRLDFYGKNSRYTAIGYDALARFLLFQAKNQGIPLCDEAVEDASTGLAIHEKIFGRKTIATARSIQTMAMIDSYLGKYENAEALAQEALEIYEGGGEYEKHAVNSTKAVLSEIQSKKGSVLPKGGEHVKSREC